MKADRIIDDRHGMQKRKGRRNGRGLIIPGRLKARGIHERRNRRRRREQENDQSSRLGGGEESIGELF